MAYKQSVDVAIIGCGPAGIAAAIQLKRSGVDCLVFEKKEIGGLLRNANLVENYPGFPDGVTGIELVRLMAKHLKAHAVEVIPLEVSGLDVSDAGFELYTEEAAFLSGIAIVATGTRPRKPDGVKFHSAVHSKVFFDVIPIIDVRDKDIVIVGGGDAAFDYALNLGRHNKVTILNRTDRTGCLGLLRERAMAVPSITYRANATPVEIAGTPEGRVSVWCGTGSGDLLLPADYVVFAIGRVPELRLISKRLLGEMEHLREEGLLHLIGDVTRGERRQTAIAVGDGVKVAMDVCARLRVQP